MRVTAHRASPPGFDGLGVFHSLSVVEKFQISP